MKTVPTKPPLPWLTIALISTLLLLAPYAMSFSPFAGVYTHGAYAAPYGDDPLSTILLLRRGAALRAVIPTLCAGIGLLFLIAFSPAYTDWLLD